MTLNINAEAPRWLTVVGVSKNAVRADWSEPPKEEMYLPYLQTQSYLEGEGGHLAYMTLVARMSCDRGAQCQPGSLATPVRESIAAIDRAVLVAQAQTMDDVVAGATAKPRFTLVLLGTFAAVALLLAAVGISGVISYAVSRRTQEIGVRMALGATRANVAGLIVGQGMRVVGVGIAAGLFGAFALTRLMTAMLYGVRVTDPLTYIGVAVLLVMVALVASYVPARRATRIDPLVAMRAD
jgi:putative ABC transport system permease protein